MDYITIGSIGFAQLGEGDYFNKREVEKKVLNEIIEKELNILIPDKFKDICFITIKKFLYENSSYDEVCLVYDNVYLEKLNDKFEEKFLELETIFSNEFGYDFLSDFPDELRETIEYQNIMNLNNESDEFWEFANSLESFDFETEQYFEQCKNAYRKECSIKIIHKANKELKNDLL
jgi:hypothetical protein